MKRVELETFFTKKSQNKFKLEQDIIDKIIQLTNIVCAPEYNKTPEFIVEKYKKKKIKNDSFLENLDFNVTVIKKNIGIEKEIDNLRILLNKLTESSFKNITQEIKIILNRIIENFDEKLFEKIANSMYQIFISNIIFSNIYTLLIKELDQYLFIRQHINDNLLNFPIYFQEEKLKNNLVKLNFDEISNDNKKFDKKKGEAQLFTNLLKENIINKHDFINLLETLMDLFFEITNIPDQISLLDKLADILFIMIKDSYYYLKKENSNIEIEGNVNYISNMKNKSRPSISNKTIFKFMDLRDLIKN